MKEKKTALVTGASSGIGLATAKALAKAGYTVYGTSRNPGALTGPDFEGIRFLPLDLTDKTSIESLILALEPLDVLVNNAGSSLMSAVEETPIDTIRELYELLLFGSIRLMQGVLPMMRERGSGIIVNVTSFAEVTPVPCSAVYASAKAALHVLSNGLRQEVGPFGIRVVTVAPTFIRTPIIQERLCDERSAYAAMIRSAGEVRDKNIKKGSPPEVVAEKILTIINKKHPASFYAAGKRAFALQTMHLLLPERIQEATVRRLFHL